MMSIEAMKRALEALELHAKQYPHMQKGYTVDAITALRQAIDQAEKQEPVAWKHAGAMPPEQEEMKKTAYNLASWLSAALDDPKVCQEYKDAINDWFDAAMPAPAAPVQEPVAYMYASIAGQIVLHRVKPIGVADAWCVQKQLENDIEVAKLHPLAHSVTPLYAAPPRREWVGLTDEEILAIGQELGLKCKLGGNPNIDFDYARAIEAKLWEKNT